MNHPTHRSRRARRAKAAGVTLVEILVVLGIVAIMLGAMVAGSGQLASARLKHATAMVASAVKVGYTRATARSKSVRLVMDMEHSAIWLEESTQPMLVSSKDASGTGGAEAATDRERAVLEETDRIVKGPRAPRASYMPVDTIALSNQGAKGPKPLPRGIKFKSIQTSHDDAPRTEGRAYLYFWPGGQTERAVIQLATGDGADDQKLTVVVSPLTGKVTLKEGDVELIVPTDEKSASEREDPAGTGVHF